MPGKILRAVLIVLLSLFVARFIWLGFTMHESGKTIGKAQVNLAMHDVKIMRQSLEILWHTYNLEEGEGKTYRTKEYDVFSNKVEEIWERHGGMPFVLPNGKNFTDFSYTGSDHTYHITVRAKDKRGTLIHGTLKELRHE